MSLEPIERKLSDVAGALARAKNEAVKFGSVFEGDAERGHYALRTPLGTLEGTYTVRDSVIRFVIEKKPRIIPYALIERVLDQFLRAG